MKISLIATVFNEEKNISRFVDSIIGQTLKPNEFIIVDAGSEDKTIEILKRYSKKYRWIKIFIEEGANRSRGRNIAIERSKSDIIIGSDAGTKYEKNWIEELIKGFVNTDLGFGKTLPLIESDFQKVLSRQMKQRFGSSRNIIFKKEVWKRVEGYPEDLDIAEDTVFNERVKRLGFRISNIPEAVCYWDMRRDLKGLKKQFYGYGYWDGVAYRKYKILPLNAKIVIIIFSLLSLAYPVFLIASVFSLPVRISITRRFSYLGGFYKGFFKLKR